MISEMMEHVKIENAQEKLDLIGMRTENLQKKVQLVEEEYNIKVREEQQVLYFFGWQEEARLAKNKLKLRLDEESMKSVEVKFPN